MTMKRSFAGLAALTVGVLLYWAAMAAAGDFEPGRYRVYRMNGRYVEGDVTQRENGDYVVQVGIGKVVIPLREVKQLVPLDSIVQRQGDIAKPTDERLFAKRRVISDEEIEEILSGITAEFDPTVHGYSREDMMAELPVNQDSVDEMKRLAGPKAKVMFKPHFTMVYTSSDDSARALGSRLESVWRNNVSFLERLNVPARLPESKLEIFYFDSQDEFQQYNLNQGSPMPAGVLGYYSPDWNRSHFFNMNNSLWAEPVKQMLEDENVPWDRKQIARNRLKRWVEYQNIEVIQHETGHHIHFNIGLFPRDSFGGGGVPIWLVEGTTMLFEVPPTEGGASIGSLNHYRLYMLRRLYGEKPLSPAEWKIFIIDNGMWHGFESYQLGWAMVYYLYKKHRDGYGEYLRRVYGREEGYEMSMTEREKEFEDIFGRIDDEWVEHFYDFLATLQVRPSLLPPGDEEAARELNRSQNSSGSRGRFGGGAPGGRRRGD